MRMLSRIVLLLSVLSGSAAAASSTTILGHALPVDAVPYAEQVLRVPCDNTRNENTFDHPVSVYQRYGCVQDLFSDTLVDLDPGFQPEPAGATSWSVAEDGITWTFHLRPGQMWNDGTPVTADDYVATFRLCASPEHAWDFAWFYSFIGEGGLRNWDRIVAGELPADSLGVTAVDALTLQIVTEGVFPAMPSVMKFGYTLQKRALEEHGPYYNSDPGTSVSSGPFMLAEFDPGYRIVLEANPDYTGYRPPRLARIEGIYMSPATYFLAYQNGEIDMVGHEQLTSADFAIIEADSSLMANYLRHYGDFRTDYILFDTFTPPFDNLDVRRAFAHAVDRKAIVSGVYGSIKAQPAHSMLMPGFPSADDSGELSELQRFDCGLARQHLADAGYPDGAGFPPLVMWLRGEPPATAAVYQASAASISQCLGIHLEVSNKDGKIFMESLNARPTRLQLGAVSYGMDFLDPANLLGAWRSGGRHSWSDPTFDRLVTEAGAMIGQPEERDQLFRQAERILVGDVGGVFIAHRWAGDLFKPHLRGDSFRRPDRHGISGNRWGDDSLWGDIYIGVTE
ncbi:MAG TPA: peptide ABC transporter substrate-binding protein [Candidatus Latescibacteria bacterium]|nr:ABC transporter substrate-binding protein [Gemmatimonadaceae bacterium]MDP7632884.1 peptide ABC transporter substrate-binding protein [Candidatus Latescibacterota bacterium]HJP33016.1 peptide ABC transporter substrate-binding protein [Candidatus Latescibacterota bacterium]